MPASPTAITDRVERLGQLKGPRSRVHTPYRAAVCLAHRPWIIDLAFEKVVIAKKNQKIIYETCVM